MIYDGGGYSVHGQTTNELFMSSLVQVVFSSVSFKWAGFRRKLGIGKDRELSLLMMAPKMDILAIIMRKIGQWHERRNKTLRYRYLTLCEIVV